ncbi:MAG: APC family permease [Planctomycetota bacterium]
MPAERGVDLGPLRRVLGSTTGVAVGVGMAVGAGILRAPGAVAHELPSQAWIFAAWLLGGLVATLDALIVAEMAASVPRVGGLAAYVRLSFGRAPAFLVGWSMLLLTWPASLAGVAVATGELVTTGAVTLAVDAPPTPMGRAVAVAVIFVVAAVNLLGLRCGARLEIALFLAKVGLLGGVCVAAALAAPPAAAVASTMSVPNEPGLLLAAFGTAMVSVIFTFDGYADAVYLAGETRDPGRALPRALLLALLTIVGLYLLANVTFLHVLGVEGLAASKFPALDVARTAFGSAGTRGLTTVALVVLLGAVNAYFLTGPRIARLLAEEGMALAALGHVPASGAPVWSTLWIALAAAAFALTNTFDQLLALTVPVISLTTVLVAVGLLVQRRRAPDRPRPFRLRAAPLVVGVQVAIGMTLLLGYLRADPRALAIDLAALGLGLLVYRRLDATAA